jgi:hypothetical protein
MPDILDKLQIQNCERHGASFIRRNPATVWRSLAGSHAAGLRVPLDKPEGEACIILHVGASAASARLLPEELMGNKAVSQLNVILVISGTACTESILGSTVRALNILVGKIGYILYKIDGI